MEKKSLALGTSDALGRFLLFGDAGRGHAATASSALQLYEDSSAVSIPVNKIVGAFKTLEPVLLSTEDNRVVRESPVLDFLQRPSPWFTRELFLETVAKNYLVTGEAYGIALGGPTRPPLEVLPMSPRNMNPIRGAGTDAPSRYYVGGNTLQGTYDALEKNRVVRFFDGPLRELAVLRSFSTRDNSLYHGQSPLISAARHARAQILGTEHNVSLLEKGGRVSLVFHYDEDMDDDEWRETRRRLRATYGGSQNAGEIVVSSGPSLTIKELAKSPKDMDYPGVQRLALESTCLVLNVPLPLVTAERQTMNNYKEAKLALFDDAVIPLSRDVFGWLSWFLLPRFGLDPEKVRLAMDPDDVSALVQRRNEELVKRRQISAETLNEIRALMGREPVEGGDVVLQPANLVPTGTDLFTTDNAVEVEEDPAFEGSP